LPILVPTSTPNIVGFTNILEGGASQTGCSTWVYASSELGLRRERPCSPFSEHHSVRPPGLALCRDQEGETSWMAHTYSHPLPTSANDRGCASSPSTGPWGRPDMALFLFTKAIIAG